MIVCFVSACYASLKNWDRAYDDAVMSVSKDPKFIKGYLRLSAAQLELQRFEDAEMTLKAALAMEPGNCSLHIFIIIFDPFPSIL
jgi:stress-induced-phosphoprotein 1